MEQMFERLDFNDYTTSMLSCIFIIVSIPTQAPICTNYLILIKVILSFKTKLNN